MAKNNQTKVECKIHKIYGYLSDKKDKVFVKVSWNGGEPRDEIRKCWHDKNGDVHLGKGIDITDDELDTLKELMKNKPRPVDFKSVFDSSIGIMDKRAAGFSTEDGFTVLRKKSTGLK